MKYRAQADDDDVFQFVAYVPVSGAARFGLVANFFEKVNAVALPAFLVPLDIPT